MLKTYIFILVTIILIACLYNLYFYSQFVQPNFTISPTEANIMFVLNLLIIFSLAVILGLNKNIKSLLDI